MPWVDPVDEFAAPPRFSPVTPSLDRWDGDVEQVHGRARLDAIEIIDTVLDACDLSRVRIETVRGTRLIGCKLGGTDLSGGTIRDTLFERCTMQYTNLRMAALERVEFVGGLDGCLLTDLRARELAERLALAMGAAIERPA